MSDAQIMTAAQRNEMLGQIRASLPKAFELIEQAGANGVVIVAIRQMADDPMRPAVVCQARRTDESTLTAEDLIYLAARSMHIGIGGEADPPSSDIGHSAHRDKS